MSRFSSPNAQKNLDLFQSNNGRLSAWRPISRWPALYCRQLARYAPVTGRLSIPFVACGWRRGHQVNWWQNITLAKSSQCLWKWLWSAWNLAGVNDCFNSIKHYVHVAGGQWGPFPIVCRWVTDRLAVPSLPLRDGMVPFFRGIWSWFASWKSGQPFPTLLLCLH